jgi:hypothetical protein
MLKRINGPKKEEVAGGWRRLHYEYLHKVYTSTCIITVIKFGRVRRAGNVTRIGEMRNAYKILVSKPEGNRSHGKPRCRWEDNSRMYIREIGWEGVDWIHLAQERDQWRYLVNTVTYLWAS